MTQDLLFLYNVFPYFRLPDVYFDNPSDPVLLLFRRLQDTGLNTTWHNPFFAPALDAQGRGSIYGARCLGGQSPLEELREYYHQLTLQLTGTPLEQQRIRDREPYHDVAWLGDIPTDNKVALQQRFATDPATPESGRCLRFDLRQFMPGANPESVMRSWTRAAQEHGIRPMADLVMNHVSKLHPWVIAEDTLLTEARRNGARFDIGTDMLLERVVLNPGTDRETSFVPLFKRWGDGYPAYASEADGKVWDDVVPFNWENPAIRPVLLEKFHRLTEYFIDLGFQGFRCDAAYHVPGEVWKDIIDHSRRYAARHYDEVLFLAETVGGPANLVARLRDVGFNYTLNSLGFLRRDGKDAAAFFREAGWFLYDEPKLLEDIGPTVGFTASHDTASDAERLINIGLHEEEALLGAIRRQIALVTFLSTGGFYYVAGSQNVVRDRMDVWNPIINDNAGNPKYMLRDDGYGGPADGNKHDLTPFIKEIIRLRRSFPVLNEPADKLVIEIPPVQVANNRGGYRTIQPPMTAIQVIDGQGECLLIIINSAMENAISPGWAAGILDRPADEVIAVATGSPGISVYRTSGLEIQESMRFQVGTPIDARSHEVLSNAR